MSLKTEPRFITSDGREFKSEENAEEWEANTPLSTFFYTYFSYLDEALARELATKMRRKPGKLIKLIGENNPFHEPTNMEEPKASDEIFSVGDVVRLKSGGPLMTVLDIVEHTDSLHCGWFPPEWVSSDKANCDTGYFSTKVLVKTSDTIKR